MTQPENQADALDEKALDAAVTAFNTFGSNMSTTPPIASAIRAYLASLPEAPAVPVGESIETLARAIHRAYLLTSNELRHDHLDLSDVDWNKWWDTDAAMPLSGPGFVKLWTACAEAAVAALQSSPPVKVDGDWRDKRIAVLEASWQKCAEQLHEVVQERNALEEKLATLASQHAVEGAVAQWQVWVEPDEDEAIVTGWVDEDADMIEHWRSKGRRVRPLYARPAAADAGVREALRECLAYIQSPLRMTRDDDEESRRTAIISRARYALAKEKTDV